MRNENVWHRIFKDWINCYKSIECISKSVIIDEEKIQELNNILLKEIIETIRSELEYDNREI